VIALRQRQRTLALAALLLFLVPLHAADKAAKRAELQQLRERIAELQQQLQKVRNRRDELREELRKSEQRIANLSRNITLLGRELDERRQRRDTLRGEERELQRSVAEQRGYLSDQVRATYAMGRQEYLKILLNQESPATVGRVVTYYDYLNKARSERINHLSDTINKLEKVRLEVEAEAKRIRELRDRQQQEKHALETSRGEREAVVVKLEKEIGSQDQRLATMLRDEDALKKLLNTLADALEDIPAEAGNRKPFPSLKGKLHWPAGGPLLVSYGSPRKVGNLRWMGVMIGANQGEVVKAISHGRVAFADWLRGYGMVIILDHGDGYMSLYGHNQSLYKETGDWVEAGETIATVGDSGGAERSGLYFEIRKNGKPTDPVRWCRR
jgi:septal ring factor EnvC (AmiA/AmiB activator)